MRHTRPPAGEDIRGCRDEPLWPGRRI